MYKILVVDDELENTKLIELYGVSLGHQVTVESNPQDVIANLQINSYDIILLDIMMPEISGLELIGEIKKITDCKIFFLSALGETTDRIKGLKVGGNDYIAKPFSLEELFLRIDNALFEVKKSTFETINNVDFDFHNNTINLAGNQVQLTNILLKLMYELVSHKGQILSREYLLKHVWNNDSTSYNRTVDTHILKLRNKLSSDSYKILTIVGKGYMYED